MTAPRVSAVVVNHRSAGEAALCVASLRDAFARESIAGEIVLVDCASGEEDTRLLADLPADAHLFLAENRGYSGGVNAGMAKARGEVLLLCNADVVFFEGAATALLAAVADPEVGVAAPLCFWDAAATLRLPADAGPRFLDELGFARFAPFARRTVGFWEHGGRAKHLVGAVLAARRGVFDRVGRFDERFPFEYEESEWEDRVRAAGLALRFEPRARVRHLFARSAARNPETETRRAASRKRYRQKRWWRAGRWILERAAGRPRTPDGAIQTIPAPVVPGRQGAWVAVSTNPSLVPFAGTPLDREKDFRLPAEILESLRPGPVYLRSFEPASGRTLETFVWEKP